MNLTESELATIPDNLRDLCRELASSGNWELTDADTDAIADSSGKVIYEASLTVQAKVMLSRIELRRKYSGEAQRLADKRLNGTDPPEYRCEDIISGFYQSEVRT